MSPGHTVTVSQLEYCPELILSVFLHWQTTSKSLGLPAGGLPAGVLQDPTVTVYETN